MKTETQGNSHKVVGTRMRLTDKQRKLSEALWFRLSIKLRSVKDRYDEYGMHADKLEYDDMRTRNLKVLTSWDWEDCMQMAGYSQKMIDAVQNLTPEGAELKNKIFEYNKL